MIKSYILRSQKPRYSLQLLQSKAEGICTVGPRPEVDLEEEEGCGERDKGTEAGVFGREGLSRALGVRHRRPQQGLRGGGREGSQPEKIRYYLPTNKRS